MPKKKGQNVTNYENNSLPIKSLKSVLAGIELVTSGITTRRANQLGHERLPPSQLGQLLFISNILRLPNTPNLDKVLPFFIKTSYQSQIKESFLDWTMLPHVCPFSQCTNHLVWMETWRGILDGKSTFT